MRLATHDLKVAFSTPCATPAAEIDWPRHDDDLRPKTLDELVLDRAQRIGLPGR
jgi:hypothetical protein